MKIIEFIPEYSLLEEKYETISDCDSEIVLRMFDAHAGGTEDVISTRMNGLESFFSYVNYGQMAVAIGERVNDSSYLWIFRNQHRPLWIIRKGESIGEMVSEPIPENINETSFKSFDGFKDYSSYEQKNYCYDVNDKCESIKNSISNIKTIVENLSYEQSISESELINLLSSLEQIDWDVIEALKILEDS